jgi:hypothetical protein
MAITYEARLARQTKNFLVYEFGQNLNGNPFSIYVPKADLPNSPQKVKLTVEEA